MTLSAPSYVRVRGAGLLAAALLAGCSGSSPPKALTLAATDFSTAPATSPVTFVGATGAMPQMTPNPAARPLPATPAVPRVGEVLDVVASPGAPARSQSEPSPSQDPVLVDATVGEVNGKPVTVSGTLEPLGARLRALSQEEGITREIWRGIANRVIAATISGLVDDELLRAEAMASIPAEHKQGFIAAMDELQKKFIGENLGNREVANQRLEEREGKTLDDWRHDTEMRELIRYQLSRKAYSRVQVSRRDIELFYENNLEQFRPHSKAMFRRISVRADDSLGIDEVTKRLAAGEPFASVATGTFNTLRGKDGGLYEKEIKGERATEEFFNSPELNTAARTMEPGSVVGPLEFGDPKKPGSTRQWLSLESIETPKGMDLYEAQLPIAQELQGRRAMEEKEKYLSRLKKRASFTAPDEMRRRLLVIAEERYFKPGLPARAPRP